MLLLPQSCDVAKQFQYGLNICTKPSSSVGYTVWILSTQPCYSTFRNIVEAIEETINPCGREGKERRHSKLHLVFISSQTA